MLKFSTEELFCQIFGVAVQGEEIIKDFGKIYFFTGFKCGYDARRKEEEEEINKK
jgi:hypothetical protein